MKMHQVEQGSLKIWSSCQKKSHVKNLCSQCWVTELSKEHIKLNPTKYNRLQPVVPRLDRIVPFVRPAFFFNFSISTRMVTVFVGFFSFRYQRNLFSDVWETPDSTGHAPLPLIDAPAPSSAIQHHLAARKNPAKIGKIRSDWVANHH